MFISRRRTAHEGYGLFRFTRWCSQPREIRVDHRHTGGRLDLGTETLGERERTLSLQVDDFIGGLIFQECEIARGGERATRDTDVSVPLFDEGRTIIE